MKSYLSEFVGTALLLAIVAGSGYMGDTLSSGNAAVALLGNSIATGAGLFVLITLLGPISGAHFNPVVTILQWQLGHFEKHKVIAYLACQFCGAYVGILITHLMFELPLIQHSIKVRTGLGMWVSEFIATLILLTTIYIGEKQSKEKLPMLITLIVTAGYWFTSSTFFSNPAVAIARGFTNTFVGISPNNVFGFVISETFALLFLVIVLSQIKKKK